MSGSIGIDIQYLTHSAFLCETDRRWLLLDFGRVPSRPACCVPDLTGLAKSGKPILVFSSHDHADHFDPDVKHWCDRTPGCRFLAGDFSRTAGATIRLEADQDRSIDDFRVMTVRATDKGVAAILQLPEINLYFGGDHAIWDDLDEFRVPYVDSMGTLAGYGVRPDVAFIPVSTSDGWQEDALIEGCRLAMTRLDPKGVVPMHAFGYESFYESFASKVADLPIPVAPIRENGDRFRFDGESFRKIPSSRG